MKFLRKYKTILILTMLSIVCFWIYSSFNIYQIKSEPVKLSSPDETANYFFAKQFAQTGDLYYFEELNGVGVNLVHPRSINVVQGKNVPGSFLGLPLIYGSLAKIFGLGALPYLTPIFSILGIIFFYLFLNYLFKREDLAFVSAVLLMFFPAWWYYSARGMYHNVVFVSLLLIGVCVLFFSLDGEKIKISNIKYQISKCLLYLISGILIGLALITRTAEIVWVGGAILFILIFNLKKIYWPGFIIFIAGIWMSFLWLFYHNIILYGSVLSLGYSAIVPGGGIAEAISTGVIFKILVSPFGWHPGVALNNAWNYLYVFLQIWSLPALLGSILFLLLPRRVLNIFSKNRYLYFLYFLLMAAYLIIFYGSWQFADRIDGKTISLGTSYLRYWLPIYVMAMPFVASLMLFIAEPFSWFNKKRGKIYKGAIILIMMMAIFIPTVNLVMRQTDESLIMLSNLQDAQVKSRLINEKTRTEDVFVIYKQADKILFPERNNIITELVNPADYEAVKRLAKIRDVYFYSMVSPKGINGYSQKYFADYGMEIVGGEKIFGKDYLYKIEIK